MASGNIPTYVGSIAVLPGREEDEVWISVLRTIDGEFIRTIERMTPRDFGDQEDAFFVDSGVLYDGDATTTIDGLDHLEGETVAILADGAVIPSQTVSGGEITLPESISKAAVGLPFRYILEPMRIDVSNASGNTMGSEKKITELSVSFIETMNAKYGKDVDNLYPFNWRTTEPYTSPPVMFTGDKTVIFDGGFSTEDSIVISGDDPTPCTVRSIVARVDKVGR